MIQLPHSSIYGGKVDYEFSFLGEKLGLNKGFTALLHAETRYGETANFEAGLLSIPNLAMVYPFPEKQETSISGRTDPWPGIGHDGSRLLLRRTQQRI